MGWEMENKSKAVESTKKQRGYVYGLFSEFEKNHDVLRCTTKTEARELLSMLVRFKERFEQQQQHAGEDNRIQALEQKVLQLTERLQQMQTTTTTNSQQERDASTFEGFPRFPVPTESRC